MNEKIIVEDDGKWYLIPYSSLREFNRWTTYTTEGDIDLIDKEWKGTNFHKCRIDYPSKVIILDYLMEY